MELRQLRYFVEIASAGSINSAAERLSIAQSAVSRQITELEVELGVLLLRRHREGISLTPSGELFLRGSSAILAEVESLAASVRTSADGPFKVRMGMPPSVSPLFLESVSARLFAEPVPLRVQLVEGSTFWLQQRLDAGDLGCAVLTNGRSSRTVSASALWRESLFLLGPSDSPMAGRASCTLDDITPIPLTLTPMHDATRMAINAAFARQGMAPTVAQEHEAMTLLTGQLETNKVYTILARTVTQHFTVRLGLIAVPIEGLSVERVLSVRRGAVPAKAAQKIADTLRAAAARRFAKDPWIQICPPGESPLSEN